MRSAVVIPNWNGSRWLTGCLDAVAAQTRPPDEVIVVDDASQDDSVDVAQVHALAPTVIALERNGGFARAVNHGIRAANADVVALVNVDVVLAEDWLERTILALEADPRAASVATKMVSMEDPGILDDTGDWLRRDGGGEQRGRFRRDQGLFDEPEEVWGACAGAALYRRDAVLGVGGFEERFVMYLEDAELALRLRLAGWRCWYEPVLARHHGASSSEHRARTVLGWAARNTVLIVAKYYPLRWAPYVVYRQVAWAYHAARDRRLRHHLASLASAVPLLPAMLRERPQARRNARVPIGEAVPPRPIRGPAAGGHPLSPA
jgi:GT2 family glycosyltransferase